MGFQTVDELYAAWAARYRHNEEHLHTDDGNIIGVGRALTYALGTAVLAQHTGGMGVGAGANPVVSDALGKLRNIMPPEYVGRAAPVELLPHFFGVFIGVATLSLQSGARSQEDFTVIDTVGRESAQMCRELLRVVTMGRPW